MLIPIAPGQPCKTCRTCNLPGLLWSRDYNGNWRLYPPTTGENPKLLYIDTRKRHFCPNYKTKRAQQLANQL